MNVIREDEGGPSDEQPRDKRPRTKFEQHAHTLARHPSVRPGTVSILKVNLSWVVASGCNVWWTPKVSFFLILHEILLLNSKSKEAF